MARVWTSIRLPVQLALVGLCAVVLTLGPFDPGVAGVRAAERPTAEAARAAFLADLRGWDDDAAKLLSLGLADCAVWATGVLPVGVPAATAGEDVADPKADAVADAARQHLCPELR